MPTVKAAPARSIFMLLCSNNPKVTGLGDKNPSRQRDAYLMKTLLTSQFQHKATE